MCSGVSSVVSTWISSAAGMPASARVPRELAQAVDEPRARRRRVILARRTVGEPRMVRATAAQHHLRTEGDGRLHQLGEQRDARHPHRPVGTDEVGRDAGALRDAETRLAQERRELLAPRAGERARRRPRNASRCAARRARRSRARAPASGDRDRWGRAPARGRASRRWLPSPLDRRRERVQERRPRARRSRRCSCGSSRTRSRRRARARRRAPSPRRPCGRMPARSARTRRPTWAAGSRPRRRHRRHRAARAAPTAAGSRSRSAPGRGCAPRPAFRRSRGSRTGAPPSAPCRCR